MKAHLSHKDPDFEAWTATLNGELVCHDQMVSADVVAGVVVSFDVDADGVHRHWMGKPQNRTRVGDVRIIERSEAVRQHEPVDRRPKMVALAEVGTAGAKKSRRHPA